MSIIKVNEIQKRTGSTLTLGGACTAVTLAPGATQSGFGRTGTVDWCTTAKTSPLTAESGKGYFVNTSGGAVTVTLPSSPSAGDIVSIKDYANTFCAACKAVTVGRGGSKIAGLCLDATLDTKGDSITLVYVDGTKGWLNIQTDDTVVGNEHIAATGGCVATCGNFKVHTFNADGNFVVSNAGQPTGSNTVEYLVVAGGGGGGGGAGSAGGGGAGGHRSNFPSPVTGGLPVSVQSYPITIGGGGSGDPGGGAPGGTGVNTSFSTITSAGGGGGRASPPGSGDGGSGGGGSYQTTCGGDGNTPPTSDPATPTQGNNGGTGALIGSGNTSGGGGGGAGAVGQNGPAGTGSRAGTGGAGAANSITGSPVTRAGGGAGHGQSGGGNTTGTGGTGGGGNSGSNGTDNTGGGGGSNGPGGGNGGKGVVIIRYKFQ
jgi:hypothetical protein